MQTRNAAGRAWRFFLALLTILMVAGVARATPLDDIGLTALLASDSTLTGTGVTVAQVEAPLTSNGNDFETDPAATGQPASLFTYISSSGTAVGTYPNAVGSGSSHAGDVGDLFYGTIASGVTSGVSHGVAPGVLHVDNYNANYFFTNYVAPGVNTSDQVINQSFIYNGQVTGVDVNYDYYVATLNKVVVSAVGNSGSPNSPSTAYNVIAVASTGASSVGPTSDGRSKPDIAAPGNATSYSTPLVSGSAALLYQAGARGDGGTGTNTSSVDSRTIKALLLNGATKPSGWAQVSPSAGFYTGLDTRYGTGIVNVYNSDLQLKGGKHTFSAATTTSHLVKTTSSVSGTATPVSTPSISSLAGWDLNTISNTTGQDAQNHYLFDLAASSTAYSLTATLTWNRNSPGANQIYTSINDLDLGFFNPNGSTIAASISTVDNVEHLYLTGITAGSYDLEVIKNGGTFVTSGETYALAWSFTGGTPVPEPASFAIFGGAIVMLAGRRRRAA